MVKRHKPVVERVHEMFRLPYRLNVRQKRTSRPFATTYIFIHGLADTGDLWSRFVKKLPKDCNYIVVDLLGHGKSHLVRGRRMYSAKAQARHILTTSVLSGLSGPIVLVGHSFGSLVAIEFANLYKGIVKHLVLIAPPIYSDNSDDNKKLLQQDDILRDIYRRALKLPKAVIAGYDLYSKLNLEGFSETNLSHDNFEAFRHTLKSGIISQKVSGKLRKLPIKTDIVYGKVDPFLIEKNFKSIAKSNKNVKLHAVKLSGHAVRGSLYDTALKYVLSEKS